jgi:hypothetical protein
VASGIEQAAAERRRDALLPSVLQRPAEHADVACATRRERAGDRVDLVAEPVGDLAYPLLGLGREVQTAQGIGDCGRRQTGLGRHIAKGDSLRPLAHRSIVTGR